MHLLDRHSRGQLTEEDLSTCLCDLVSFVLRRTVCGESTRAYSRWFIEAIGAAGDTPVERLRRYWLERGWPDDAAFTRALGDFHIYKREPRKARMPVLLEAAAHRDRSQSSNPVQATLADLRRSPDRVERGSIYLGRVVADERSLKHVAQRPFDGTHRDPIMESTTLDLVLERLDRIEDVLHQFVQRRAVKESYSPAEVAQILGKKPYTVREWCRLKLKFPFWS
ncbi:MAG: hypothetical protein GXY55_10505 [Phycisphaerae bacterium]|nr:hypothetical protein [Phycisphaerae bacterium]